jgi:hypothetical protein
MLGYFNGASNSIFPNEPATGLGVANVAFVGHFRQKIMVL